MKTKYLLYPSLWTVIKGLFKGVFYKSVLRSEYQDVIVDGAYKEGDGGGGLFHYEKHPEQQDNEGTIIMPEYGPCGKWVKV